MNVSFQKPEETILSHQDEKMPEVPPPEKCKSRLQIMEEFVKDEMQSLRLRDFFTQNYINVPHAVEIRPTSYWGPGPLRRDNEEPRQSFWCRVRGKLPDDFYIHCSCLSYMADFGMVNTAQRPFYGIMKTSKVQSASLDHSMWFHTTEFRADDWLLYHVYSPKIGNSRGLSFGYFFNREGVLVCSTAQEGLTRVRGKRKKANL